MGSKLVSLQSNSPRHLSSVFGDYQGEICDLLLAINVVRLALEAEEDNRAQSGTARIALEHLEDMATELKTKWHEDYQLEGAVLNLGARPAIACARLKQSRRDIIGSEVVASATVAAKSAAVPPTDFSGRLRWRRR